MAEEEAKKLDTVEETTAPVEAEEKYAKAGKKSKKHVEEVKAEEARQAYPDPLCRLRWTGCSVCR